MIATPAVQLDSVEPAYLTPADVAKLLVVSEKSIYRWAAADPTMPALRVAGTVRFHRERLLTWLRDREQGRPRMRRQVLSRPKSAPRQEAPGA